MSEKNKPKVLLIFCGGTISMIKDKNGGLSSHHGANQFFEMEPRVKELADIDTHEVCNIDSTNMGTNEWEAIVEVIEKKYHEYDGFLITCGTNTLAYASSALSFALYGIGKPVVLTGAQVPADFLSSDARNNFVNALQTCVADLSGVYVVFGTRIILGCRAKKVSEAALEAFKTFNGADFGSIGVGMIFSSNTNSRHGRTFRPQNGFNDEICCFTLLPGLSADILKNSIDSGIKALILRAYGTGDIPDYLFSALEYAKENEVPVIVTTQCPDGATVMGINSIGIEALKYGVIQAFDMSMESMSTKLMWLLAQETPYDRIKEMITEDYCGEINTKKAQFLINKDLAEVYGELNENI